ncbi:MAG: hypothetical protein K0S06_2825 [Microvirga sp.]|nr:hypothetical protein [Microvirga sp.]
MVGKANCIQGIGLLARFRSDLNTARERLDEALPLYRNVGAVMGEANCLLILGDLAWRSEPDTARERLQDALRLYRKIGDVLGEANCIYDIGEIALSRAEYSAARQLFEDALALYRSVAHRYAGPVLIRKGQLAQLSASGAARAHFDAALALFEREPKNLALPGWRAFHAALVATDAAVAAEKREEARAHWTRVGRLDLVDRFLDLPVVRDETGSAAA